VERVGSVGRDVDTAYVSRSREVRASLPARWLVYRQCFDSYRLIRYHVVDMNRDPLPSGHLPSRPRWWPMIFAAFIIVLPLSPPVRGVPDEPQWTLDWVGVAVFLAR
jgi:hypothetical protein